MHTHTHSHSLRIGHPEANRLYFICMYQQMAVWLALTYCTVYYNCVPLRDSISCKAASAFMQTRQDTCLIACMLQNNSICVHKWTSKCVLHVAMVIKWAVCECVCVCAYCIATIVIPLENL